MVINYLNYCFELLWRYHFSVLLFYRLEEQHVVWPVAGQPECDSGHAGQVEASQTGLQRGDICLCSHPLLQQRPGGGVLDSVQGEGQAIHGRNPFLYYSVQLQICFQTY